MDQRISPLYVSVHATEPEVRIRLLKNDRAGLIMDQLRFLLDNGLEVHTQVVLCPDWNDGAHLDRTMEDLLALGTGVRTLSVVPVGLTKYNINRPFGPLTPEEAGRAIDQVDAIRRPGPGGAGPGMGLLRRRDVSPRRTPSPAGGILRLVGPHRERGRIGRRPSCELSTRVWQRSRGWRAAGSGF